MQIVHKKKSNTKDRKNDLQRNKHEEDTQVGQAAGAKGQQGAVKQNQRPSRDDETRIEGTDNFAEKKKQTEGKLTETRR